MLERRGRTPPRHLAADGEGSLGRAPPEARLRPAPADPACVPLADRPRPAGEKPRSGSDRLRGLTARACGLSRSQARCPQFRARYASEGPGEPEAGMEEE